jgi:hypothetical protein
MESVYVYEIFPKFQFPIFQYHPIFLLFTNKCLKE